MNSQILGPYPSRHPERGEVAYVLVDGDPRVYPIYRDDPERRLRCGANVSYVLNGHEEPLLVAIARAQRALGFDIAFAHSGPLSGMGDVRLYGPPWAPVSRAALRASLTRRGLPLPPALAEESATA